MYSIKKGSPLKLQSQLVVLELSKQTGGKEDKIQDILDVSIIQIVSNINKLLCRFSFSITLFGRRNNKILLLKLVFTDHGKTIDGVVSTGTNLESEVAKDDFTFGAAVENIKVLCIRKQEKKKKKAHITRFIVLSRVIQ